MGAAGGEGEGGKSSAPAGTLAGRGAGTFPLIPPTAAAAVAAAAATAAAAVAAASTATAAAAVAAASTATAAAALGLGPCFVHGQASAIDLLAVEGGNGGLGLLVAAHLHETEALRAPGVAVHDDLGGLHGPVG